MKVFVFDRVPNGENLGHLKCGATELPWPLAKQHFRPEVAVRTYAEHLDPLWFRARHPARIQRFQHSPG